MDIGGLDLEGIEKDCTDVEKGYVPQEQVILLKESILQYQASKQLGIISGYHKETKRKFEELAKKARQKLNKQRVSEASRKLVESGQYPTIKRALGL